MNTNMNKSQYDWYMDWFKKSVRYIVSDIQELPEIAAAFGYQMTDSEKEDLKTIMPEIKSMCLGLYDAYFRREMDITNYVDDLRKNFKNRFDVILTFYALDSSAMSPEEPPCAYYNSLHVEHGKLHIRLLKQQLSKIACELADSADGCQYLRDAVDFYAPEIDECIENCEPEELPF